MTAAVPAHGLEIFGFRLWGREEPETIEVIDPLAYDVAFTIAPDRDDLEDDVRNASSLWRDREEPASGFAGLLSTARGDYRRILAALYNRGFYGPEISITLDGREAADLSIADALAGPVAVAITVNPGPRFRFGVARIVNEPRWPVEEDMETGPGSVGFEPGEPARAGAVTAASSLAIERWRQLSHAAAEETGREVVADHATSLLDATVVLDPGPAARYGTTAAQGSRRVDADFIAYMADFEPGDRFDPDDVEAARDRLGALGTFGLIRIEEGPIGPDGTLPMTVLVEDRLPRSFGVGATISTLDGVGLEGFWVHRNLFGRAEQLRFDATVTGIGTGSADELTYTVGPTFVRPGVIEPNTNFVASLLGRRQDFDTYRETAAIGRVGLSRQFGRGLRGDVFFEVIRSRVEDDFGTRDFLTIGTPVTLSYDRRDSTVDPTEGYFLLGETKPFYEAEFGNFALRGAIEGRAYRGFGEERRFVLAGRARIGSYIGPSIEESPPDQLFFAGGGGSVRGYPFRSIGVEAVDVDGEPVVSGGRSLLEGSGEVRYRINDRFGAVAFFDTGMVAAGSALDGDQDMRSGAGLGVRYYTNFGPLRVDVAAPLDKRPDDSAVALYIGIGQAF
jgi:translocation and assembly module TamA